MHSSEMSVATDNVFVVCLFGDGCKFHLQLPAGISSNLQMQNIKRWSLDVPHIKSRCLSLFPEGVVG